MFLSNSRAGYCYCSSYGPFLEVVEEVVVEVVAGLLVLEVEVLEVLEVEVGTF